MKIPCYRCGGDGHLPQFEWNKAGICFTCGGDGIVNTFSTIKLNKMTMGYEMRDYIHHSFNRDLAELYRSGAISSVKDRQASEVRIELTERAEKYFGLKSSDYKDTFGLAEEFLNRLDDLEKNFPQTHEKSPYFEAGKVSLVPVHWLKKFQGNPLRRDEKEMKEFKEQLMKEGLKDPVYIMVGRDDRRVSVGEGNHRMNAFIDMGMDYVPARVATYRTNSGHYSQFYDKMSRVPVNDYYSADANPKEVFDTMYDHGSLTAMDEKALNKLQFESVKLPRLMENGLVLNGLYKKNAEVKILVGQQFSKVSKNLVEELDAMTDQLEELLTNEQYKEYAENITPEKLGEILEEALDWYSMKDGVATIDVGKAIELLNDYITGIELKAFQDLMNRISKDKKSTPAEKNSQEFLDEDDSWLWDILDED